MPLKPCLPYHLLVTELPDGSTMYSQTMPAVGRGGDGSAEYGAVPMSTSPRKARARVRAHKDLPAEGDISEQAALELQQLKAWRKTMQLLRDRLAVLEEEKAQSNGWTTNTSSLAQEVDALKLEAARADAEAKENELLVKNLLSRLGNREREVAESQNALNNANARIFELEAQKAALENVVRAQADSQAALALQTAVAGSPMRISGGGFSSPTGASGATAFLVDSGLDDAVDAEVDDEGGGDCAFVLDEGKAEGAAAAAAAAAVAVEPAAAEAAAVETEVGAAEEPVVIEVTEAGEAEAEAEVEVEVEVEDEAEVEELTELPDIGAMEDEAGAVAEAFAELEAAMEPDTNDDDAADAGGEADAAAEAEAVVEVEAEVEVEVDVESEPAVVEEPAAPAVPAAAPAAKEETGAEDTVAAPAAEEETEKGGENESPVDPSEQSSEPVVPTPPVEVEPIEAVGEVEEAAAPPVEEQNLPYGVHPIGTTLTVPTWVHLGPGAKSKR